MNAPARQVGERPCAICDGAGRKARAHHAMRCSACGSAIAFCSKCASKGRHIETYATHQQQRGCADGKPVRVELEDLELEQRQAPDLVLLETKARAIEGRVWTMPPAREIERPLDTSRAPLVMPVRLETDPPIGCFNEGCLGVLAPDVTHPKYLPPTRLVWKCARCGLVVVAVAAGEAGLAPASFAMAPSSAPPRPVLLLSAIDRLLEVRAALHATGLELTAAGAGLGDLRDVEAKLERLTDELRAEVGQ